MTAYLVTGRHPSCIRMADDEVANIDRLMERRSLDDLKSLRPTKHWFMAVLVCPGDDLAGLATWARGKDSQRVHFYLHPDADLQQLAAWRDAGHPLSRVASQRYAHYGKLHAKLGLDLSDQVYGDFAP